MKSFYIKIIAAVMAAFVLGSCTAANSTGSTAAAEPTEAAESTSETTTVSSVQIITKRLNPKDNTAADILTEPLPLPDTEPETDDSIIGTGEESDTVTADTAETGTETESVSVTDGTTAGSSAGTASDTPAETTVPVSESSGAGGAGTTAPPVSETEETTVLTTYKYYDYHVYDASFFDKSLFIGDSISTGLPLYKYLNNKNVFAKIGLNPSTALTKRLSTAYGTYTAAETCYYMKPDRAYIMLGSNGIQWMTVKNLMSCMEKLCNDILSYSPGTEIVIISVPPVTKGYNSSNPGTMNRINEFNSNLKLMCEEKGWQFVDICSQLKDTSGFFASEFAERDGLHFKAKAYQTMLGQIYLDMTYGMITEEEQMKIIEAIMPETSVTVVGSETEIPEETAAETIVTSVTTVPETSETTVPSEPVTKKPPVTETAPAETSVTAATTVPPVETEETTEKKTGKKKKKKQTETASDEYVFIDFEDED